MTLDGALSIASGSLANINRQLALVSHNVANANTPGYITETASQQSLTADGVGMGVVTGVATRNVDTALQANSIRQNSTVADLQTQQSTLATIDAALGTPGAGTDLPSLLGDLQNQFSSLLNSPDSQTQQAQVVSSAATLARGINSLSRAYGTARQAAQDDIGSAVATLNTSLSTIGSLSDQIVALKAQGGSTADLENQRDSAVQTLSQLVSVKVLQQPNGDVTIATGAGLILPTRGELGQVQTTPANLDAHASYPGGGIPGIMLGGVDVTSQLSGGRIGADVALRDQILPTFQGELDEFAQNVASRFDAQGLRLFTDASGGVPATSGTPPVQANYVGFASTIQVNQAVAATPSLVRDGTAAAATGLAGYTGVIQNVLQYTFGAEQAPGVPQPTSNIAGLGPTGNLSAPYAASPTLSGLASAVVGAQAQVSSNTSTQLDAEQAVQSTLNSKLASDGGVNMDTEMATMIQLQNAYGANARILAAVQTMWSQLVSAVQP
ncbi:MAG: flagellar hook-associated protein FlgK [Acetobacteraceae bacterium]|nr:flagellar hook-associated protein FlgK [Acetobacteraceae bacterium]